MQLKKNDVKELDVAGLFKDERSLTKVLNYSKIQQVVEFYEKYVDNSFDLENDHPEIYKLFPFPYDTDEYNRWLFNYCFVEELK